MFLGIRTVIYPAPRPGGEQGLVHRVCWASSRTSTSPSTSVTTSAGTSSASTRTPTRPPDPSRTGVCADIDVAYRTLLEAGARAAHRGDRNRRRNPGGQCPRTRRHVPGPDREPALPAARPTGGQPRPRPLTTAFVSGDQLDVGRDEPARHRPAHARSTRPRAMRCAPVRSPNRSGIRVSASTPNGARTQRHRPDRRDERERSNQQRQTNDAAHQVHRHRRAGERVLVQHLHLAHRRPPV